MFQSIWTDSVKLREFKTMHGDQKTDVLIIGGGLCGILCAYFLQRAGVDYMLAEKNRIGCGITGNTTAKITSQHGLIYHQLIDRLGREQALKYFTANQKAVEQYRKLAKTVDCDFEEKCAAVYTCRDRQKIEDEVKAVNALGFPAEFMDQLPIPVDMEGAVVFPEQAQFHPLKFIAGISENLNIYEQTFVQKVEGHRVWTNQGMITADKIIAATHFPFLNRHGSYFLKLYQHRSYVLALEDAPDVGGMYIDESKQGLSFRNYKNMLFIGGGSHRTGKSGGSWKVLREFAAAAYPQAKEVYAWAAQDCMSLDGMPYIGQYSKNTPNLYVASGFNKWGMTTSMAAAMILCDRVLGRDNEWEEVFDPARCMRKSQLFVNGTEALSHLLIPSFRRCPHMGCVLQWNKEERTWDCPCHGSRFEKDGTLIDNPANKNRD